MPEFVDMNNITFHLGYSDSFSGALHMTVNNDPFVTLENALNEIFHSLNYKSCLLTIGMNTVAIMMPFPDVFKVILTQEIFMVCLVYQAIVFLFWLKGSRILFNIFT